MKILFFSDNLRQGGKERRMIELLKGLSDRPDIHIELVLFRNVIEYPEIHELGVPLHIIERIPKNNPMTFVKLYTLCKKLRPDIVHAWSSMCATFAIPATRLLPIKLLNGCIANAPKNLGFWDKDLLKARLTFPFSDVIVGNSKAGLRAYGAPESRSLSIYNGFDFNRISGLAETEPLRKTYGTGTNFIVGKIAAFAERKDYETYVAAACRIIEQRSDVSFFAIGDGPNLESIKASVPKSAKDNIIFTGAVGDVESLIQLFDIGVLCTNSDVHGEGISNSILEYMALGKPVVATEGGGTNEIVSDGKTGFLVPPKSAEVLAERILKLLNHALQRQLMGAAGRKRIETEFSLQRMTDVYLDLYRELISG